MKTGTELYVVVTGKHSLSAKPPARFELRRPVLVREQLVGPSAIRKAYMHPLRPPDVRSTEVELVIRPMTVA